LGQIDLNGALGRRFGGLGVALEQPNVELVVEKAQQVEVVGASGNTKRKVEHLAEQYLGYFGVKQGAKIHIKQTIPGHVGLGSTTQLALAVGFALAKIYGRKVSVEELAQVGDRGGSRSGIGVAVFRQGGFVVDAGMREDTIKGGTRGYLPPVLFAHPFPGEWRFVVAVLPSTPGLHGAEEAEAFRRLPPMEPETVGRICRLLLMQILPALVERDLVAFGQALTEIQQTVGAYFSPVQQGVFASPLAEETIEFMAKHGARGVGQSSWGPTVYGLVDREKAVVLEHRLRRYLATRGNGKVYRTRVINTGADWDWLMEKGDNRYEKVADSIR